MTELVDKYMATSKWSREKEREFSLLGSLEKYGGGYTSEQLIPLVMSGRFAAGSEAQYMKTLGKLEARGFVQDLGKE